MLIIIKAEETVREMVSEAFTQSREDPYFNIVPREGKIVRAEFRGSSKLQLLKIFHTFIYACVEKI